MGLLIIGFILGLAGIALLAMSESIYSKYKHKKMNCTEVTDGVVYRYMKKDNAHIAHVKYQINNVSYKNQLKDDDEKAPLPEKFPIDSKIPVYYNPQDPKESFVLKLVKRSEAIFILIAGIAFALTSIVILVMHFV